MWHICTSQHLLLLFGWQHPPFKPIFSMFSQFAPGLRLAGPLLHLIGQLLHAFRLSQCSYKIAIKFYEIYILKSVYTCMLQSSATNSQIPVHSLKMPVSQIYFDHVSPGRRQVIFTLNICTTRIYIYIYI